MATVKQKRAAKLVLENLGVDHPKSMGKILVEAGYSQNVADTPTLVTETKGYQELLEEFLPEALLMKVHSEGLNAKLFRFSPEGEVMQFDDFSTRHKYLETAYKVKGKLEPEGKGKILIINISGQSAQRYGADPSPSDNSVRPA